MSFDVSIARKSLLGLLDDAMRATGDGSIMPLNACVRLKGAGRSLNAFAANHCLAVDARVEASINAEGAALVDAKLLRKVVAGMPEGDLRMALGEKDFSLNITAPRRKNRLVGLDPQTFPSEPVLASPLRFDIDAKLLHDMIVLVAPMVSDDQSRPHIASVLLDFSGQTLTAVATNSKALVKDQRPCTTPACKMLVPRAVASELVRVLAAVSGSVPIEFSRGSGRISIAVDGKVWVGSLYDGAFPSWEQVVPSSTEATVRLNREEFFSALRSMTTLGLLDGAKNQVVFRIDGAAKELTIHASSDEGEQSVSIPCEITGKHAPRVGVNRDNFMAALSGMVGEVVDFGCSQELDPLTLTTPTMPEYVAVIMPARI